MPLGFYQDQQSQNEMMDGYINHHENMNRVRGSISITDEYKNQIGKEYQEARQTHGKMMVSKKHIRNADIKAAERMYVAGYNKKDTINTIMRKSPMTRNMNPMQKMAYREKLGRYMKKVEPLRQEVAESKQRYGIKSNRVKDIKDYGKVIQAQQKARQHKVKVKPMSYQKFLKDNSPNTQQKYQAEIERKIAEQRKIEQAQKQAAQAQRNTQKQRL